MTGCYTKLLQKDMTEQETAGLISALINIYGAIGIYDYPKFCQFLHVTVCHKF